MRPNMEKTDCLIRCHGEHCSSSQCCSRENFVEDTCKSAKDAHIISKKYDKKEIIPAACAISLEKFTVYEEETVDRAANDPKMEKSACNLINVTRINNEQIHSSVSSDTDVSSRAINTKKSNQIVASIVNNQISVDTNLDSTIIS